VIAHRKLVIRRLFLTAPHDGPALAFDRLKDDRNSINLTKGRNRIAVVVETMNHPNSEV